MQNIIYQTLNLSKYLNSDKTRDSNKKFLASLKSIIKQNRKPKQSSKGKLNECLSLDQIAEKREMNKKQQHEEMLRNELMEFRQEIEEKFRASETNRTYRFHKNFTEFSSPISEKVDCNLIVQYSICY